MTELTEHFRRLVTALLALSPPQVANPPGSNIKIHHIFCASLEAPNTTFTMKILTVLYALCATAVAGLDNSAPINPLGRATVYIQPVQATSPLAAPLAEIKFNPSTLSSEIVSYDAPEIAPEAKLLRVGIYDAASATWISSTSVTSAESFAKGYQPTIVLSLDGQGEVVGVSCKSGSIDAGATRDFGPKVKVVRSVKGKGPELNRPVVLSAEGKIAEPEVEKTLLQK